MSNPIAGRWPARYYLFMLSLFVLALVPRLYSAQTLGWDWYGPGSFTLVNFDEGGSCRAALDGFDYSGLVGRQTVAIAGLLGAGPEAGIVGDTAAVKAYCHSPAHLLVARMFSALTGAMTVVALCVIALLLVPATPAIAWTAGALLALSGFHISESHSATVDAPSVFFIYSFLAWMVFASVTRSRLAMLISPLFLVPAVWAKYWVFALFAYGAWLPQRLWGFLSSGISARRLVAIVVGTALLFGLLGNSAFQRLGLYPLLGLYYLLIPWQRIKRPMIVFWLLVPVVAYLLCRIDLIAAYTMGSMSGRFGTSYGAIGWHKWLRNLLNVPLVLAVGLGLPALVFILSGIRNAMRALPHDGEKLRGWLCLLPVVAFVLFMAFVAPVTYYRHYLALLPAGALLAAYGLHTTRWGSRPWFLALFFAWPALLAWDLVVDYHHDPRRQLPAWFQAHPNARVFTSFYVNPPPVTAGNLRLFRPEYAQGDAAALRQADYLILSENWYDTAFANELNGPLTDDLSQLVKTTAQAAQFYRAAVRNEHPYLQLEQRLAVENYMPELWLHKRFYGTFQLFVGDLRIYRVLR
tara:strand:- start:199742 stop:201475 length:1734 start_codon:yes stop_codon:yes gene_type:complete